MIDLHAKNTVFGMVMVNLFKLVIDLPFEIERQTHTHTGTWHRHSKAQNSTTPCIVTKQLQLKTTMFACKIQTKIGCMKCFCVVYVKSGSEYELFDK